MESITGMHLKETLGNLGIDVENISNDKFQQQFESPNMVPFLEWFCQYITPENVISPEELKEYDDLMKHDESSNLSVSVSSDCTVTPFDMDENDAEDIELLKEEVKAAELHLQRLNEMSLEIERQNTCCKEEIAELKKASRIIKHQMNRIEDDCFKLNETLNQSFFKLAMSLDELSTVFEAFGEAGRQSMFVSSKDLSMFKDLTSIYDGHLESYMMKQFEQRAAILAGQNDGRKYQLLDLRDPNISLVKGQESSAYERHLNEFLRLKQCYFKAEVDRVLWLAEEKATAAAIESAKKLIQDIKSGKFTLVPTSLSGELADLQSVVYSLMIDTEQLKKVSLIQVAKQCSQHQAALALTGDYNLKLKRQNYYIDKLNIVQDCLVSQNLHFKMLWLCLHSEKERLEQMANFFQLSDSYLCTELKHHEARMAQMAKISKNLSGKEMIIPAQNPLLKIAQQILFSTKSEAKEHSLVTFSKFAEELSDLQQSLMESERELDLMFTSQNKELIQMNNDMYDLKKALFSGTTKKPVITPIPVQHALYSVMTSMENLAKNFSELSAKIRDKREALDIHPELKLERDLWILFIRNPSKLIQEVRSLEEKAAMMRGN